MGRRHRNRNKTLATTIMGPKTIPSGRGMPTYKDPNKVFQIGETSIYAGAGHDIRSSVIPWSFLLNCAGPDGYPVRRIAGALITSLDWQDGDVPRLEHGDWTNVINFMLTHKGSVGVYCVGGHGRTGTALAIIASLSGLCTDDPVKFIRDIYDPSSIETQEQIDYIKRITGLETTAKPSWGPLLPLGKWDAQDDLWWEDYKARTLAPRPMGFQQPLPALSYQYAEPQHWVLSATINDTDYEWWVTSRDKPDIKAVFTKFPDFNATRRDSYLIQNESELPDIEEWLVHVHIAGAAVELSMPSYPTTVTINERLAKIGMTFELNNPNHWWRVLPRSIAA